MFAEPPISVIAEKIALIRKQSRGLCHYQSSRIALFGVATVALAVGRAADRANNETHSHGLASVAAFGIWHSIGEFSDQREANFVTAYD